MDRGKKGTYHGSTFNRRPSPKEVFFKKPYTLNKAVLFLQHPKLQPFYSKADPDKLLHLETLQLQQLKKEIINYKVKLEQQGIEVYTKEFEAFLPNIFFASDTFFSFKGDVYVSNMASDIRRLEEPHVYTFFHDLGMNPVDIFNVGEYMESSDLLYVNGNFYIGNGHRTNRKAINKVKNYFSQPVIPITLPNDIQHLMGVARPLSNETIAIRHEKLSKEALSKLMQSFQRVIKVGETLEVKEKQAFNFVPYEKMNIFMPDDCPKTQQYYEERGIEVKTVTIEEIRKGGGGLACLTGRLE